MRFYRLPTCRQGIITLVFVNSDDVRKANANKGYLLHDGMTPSADEQDKEEMGHGKIIPDEFGSSPEQKEHAEVISPFAAPFASSQADHRMNSSTAHMDDEVADVNSRWPLVKSLDNLHRINQDIYPAFKELISSPQSRQKLLDMVLNVCAKTMTLVPQYLSDEL